MSDENRPGDVPPDLPPEYAEAYRRGYEQAVKRAAGEESETTATFEQPPPLFADEIDEPLPERPGGAHKAGPEPDPDLDPGPELMPLSLEEQLAEEEPAAPRERPAWLVPALLAGLVVILLLSAYGIGRVVSSNLSGTQVSQEEPDGVVIGENGSTSAPSQSASHKAQGKKYAGNTDAARIGGASASCESASGVDSAGNKVSYEPGNVYDEDMTTAWRCDGDGTGEKLTINLADPTRIGEVGLIPGYAKTDPRSGEDRYAENNRISKVRWVFDDGTTVEQTFDTSAKHRSMQTMRIPVTKADRVVVEILGAERGPRNTVAVSEVRIGQVAD